MAQLPSQGSNQRGGGAGQGRGQAAAMQLGELMQLGRSQTFETSIARMQRPREVGSFEPQTQGFGIDA